MQSFEVHTSCGKVIKQSLSEASDWQLSLLIEQNADNPDTQALRDELARRRSSVTKWLAEQEAA